MPFFLSSLWSKNPYFWYCLVVLLGHFALVIWGLDTLHISMREANLLIEGIGFDAWLLKFFVSNDLKEGLAVGHLKMRLGYFGLYVAHMMAMLYVAWRYLRSWSSMALFLCFYGLALAPLLSIWLSTQALINMVALSGFLALCFLPITKWHSSWLALALGGLFFVDNAMAMLFLSMAWYILGYKNTPFAKWLGFWAFGLFVLSMVFWGFDMDRKPINGFLPYLAQLAFLFSPLVFVFMIAALFRFMSIQRRLFKKDVLWFVVMVPFLFSTTIALRQTVDVEDFAFFLVFGLMVLAKTFMYSYQLRLRHLRTKHNWWLGLSMAMAVMVLLLPVGLVWAKQPWGAMMVRDHLLAASVAKALQDGNFSSVQIPKHWQNRLKAYGVQDGTKNVLHFDASLGGKPFEVRFGNYREYFYVQVP